MRLAKPQPENTRLKSRAMPKWRAHAPHSNPNHSLYAYHADVRYNIRVICGPAKATYRLARENQLAAQVNNATAFNLYL